MSVICPMVDKIVSELGRNSVSYHNHRISTLGLEERFGSDENEMNEIKLKKKTEKRYIPRYLNDISKKSKEDLL